LTRIDSAMNSAAEEALQAGDPTLALAELQSQVRSSPADAKLRVFLFQLLCVLGQWDRALTQLELCAQMDASALPMRETYRDAIHCEMLRAEVFKGRKSPMLFGEPEGWIAQLIEALIRAGRGEAAAANQLRDEAFEAAPASPGQADDQRFEWIADADMRLGPLLEAIVNGRYYWVPFSRLSKVAIEAPEDLRDAVWAPANLEFINGGQTIALIPTRYPGSESAADGRVVLGRKTVWDEIAPGVHAGLGQRVLATDRAEIGLLDLRSLVFDPPGAING
jgi:type VI secretion system protein ImpE